MSPEEFLAAVGPAAVACMKVTRIPASFTLAQAIEESGWGASKGTALGCNLFNIKASKAWHGPTFWNDTLEFIQGKNVRVPAEWRKYENWQMCINDHAKFLTENPRYQSCFLHLGDGEKFAQAVAAAGYATDPNYAAKLIAVMRSRDLKAYDAI